ncbi:MAG: hypothetical protein LCH92_08145 [Proteobacteria bacterium]|nr:hypothetical protein [Pseudomonadota bacterium]
MNAYVSDATAKDLSSHLGFVASRGEGGVSAHFFYQRVPQSRGKSAFRTQLCVAMTPIGDRYTISTKYIDEKEARERFPAQYDAFTRSADLPSTGTPLTELPGITMSQVGQLLISGIRSVEDLCSLSADQAQNIGREIAVAHKLATGWAGRRDAASDKISEAEREARRDQEARELRATIARLEAQNAALAAKNDALSSMGGRAAPAAPAAAEAEGEDLPDPSTMPGIGEESDFSSVQGNNDLLSDPLA